MPRGDPDRKQPRRSISAGYVRVADRQTQLLRYIHIFSASVREILELRLLEEASPVSLTLSQFHFLRAITANGGHQVGEVAGLLGVSPPAATKSLNKLEGLGLVVRSPSKGDRRATLLSSSPKGRRLVRKYEGLQFSLLGRVLEQFSSEELDRMTRLLERFSISLLDTEQAGNGSCLRCGAYIEESCRVGETRGGCPYQQACGSRTADGTPQDVS